MKKIALTLSALALGLASLQATPDAQTAGDADLKKILVSKSEPRGLHYIGSQDGFDWFCSEQWALHSYPPKARSTERYYKVKDSTLVHERFPVTEDVKKWVRIAPEGQTDGPAEGR